MTFQPNRLDGFDLASERRSLGKRAAARCDVDRIEFARAAASAVISSYWARIGAAEGDAIPIRMSPVPTIEVSLEPFARYAEACAQHDTLEAFYHIGELYTALLPEDYRTRHGIYYTPPQLVTRLLDVIETSGVDWHTARVLDPACGGAAFVAYVAQRMLRANVHLSAEDRLRDLSQRLLGFDIDPFATWLSSVLLDVVCLPVIRRANRYLSGIIHTGDMLLQDPAEIGNFDLIIGNPPYGKLTLSAEQRRRFSRSLYGHANLYGVFTDLAVQLCRPRGLIGFVTPTSFLGGEYFKNLRRLLSTEAKPTHVSFVSDREGVFADVLQETMLVVVRRQPENAPKRKGATGGAPVEIEQLQPQAAEDRHPSIEQLGKMTIVEGDGAPWILPRSRKQAEMVRQLNAMAARLSDYGYRVATGQLVWNRHKSQFRDRPGENCYPVLWAECIQSDGTFEFRAQNRNHRPYLQVEEEQAFLINQEPCVLVQRTTSKEQPRRLIATVVPNGFILEHPGYVVENHVNMVVPTRSRPAVPMSLLARLLNSSPVDHAFRCISGSVAVSAYEMESLPLPAPSRLMNELRGSSRWATRSADFERIVRSLYHDF